MTYGYYIVLILLLFEVSGNDVTYFVSKIHSQWQGSGNICSIAVPPIKHTTSGIAVEINSTLLDADDAWVGYIQIQRFFNYIGCFKQSYSNMIRLENVKVGSPGQCFALCNHSSLIGLSVNECFCIADTSSLADLQSNYTNCTTECESQSGIACGSQRKHGPTFVSIYKDTHIDENITSDKDEEAHCLRLDPVIKTFVWTQCSKNLLVFCDFGGICIATSSKGIRKTWIENANLCFSNGGSPMRAKTCSQNLAIARKEGYSLYNNTNSPVWTSFVLSSVVSSSRNQTVESGIQFGYIRKQEGRIVLKFTKAVSENKTILCNNQQIQNLKENEKLKQGNKLSLLVTIAIPAVAVLVVIMMMIFTVVLWRRRKCRQRHKRNNIPQYDTPVISFITNASYAHLDDTVDQIQLNQEDDANQRIEGNHGQSYNIALKDAEKSSDSTFRKDEHDKRYSANDRIDDIICKPGIAKTDNSQSSGDNTVHNYYILEKKSQPDTKSKYDMTKVSKKTSKESDANVYNKLVFDKEQTYDHAFQTKPNICTASPDTYNTIAAVHISSQSDVPVVSVQK